MELRTAIRYSEYKSADKLPQKYNCNECRESELVDKRNCGGEGNPKFSIKIGGMEFYQCPLSIPTQEAWDVIELISLSEETGIPIHGTCLLDQTLKFFEYRRIINSERYECRKELDDIRKRDMDKKSKNRESKPAVGSRSRLPKK